jgi:heptosyltransferase II
MKKPNLKDFKTFAIVQTAFLGDVVLTLPLVHQIKQQNLSAKIIFVTLPAAATLTECINDIDESIIYDKHGRDKGISGLLNLAKLLKSKKVDCILAPHRSMRTALLTMFTHPLYSVGFNTSSLSIAYKFRSRYYFGMHESRRNLNLLTAFYDANYFPKQVSGNIQIPHQSTQKVKEILKRTNINDKDKIIAIAPGAAWTTKRWLPEYFSELSNKFINSGYKIVLIGAESDKAVCNDVEKNSNVLNLSGKTTIPELLALLSLTKLLISNDSAPVHLAGLVKCPVACIFGPTSQSFGFAPIGEKDLIFEKTDLQCHPCRIHGGDRCPTGTFDCMRNITHSDVFSTITNHLLKHN